MLLVPEDFSMGFSFQNLLRWMSSYAGSTPHNQSSNSVAKFVGLPETPRRRTRDLDTRPSDSATPKNQEQPIQWSQKDKTSEATKGSTVHGERRTETDQNTLPTKRVLQVDLMRLESQGSP
ncbi:hypothetical protein O181_048417 [Austropuccinia psidii MF-1]|uniref:Uncharacterized protein n=1 Tax=Austropuccinia psidii MF-1 TaxID=1389203 RepID=A0A9Q3DV28_9BASI|nr:hypothetical protein [Austropuccinia psidii MF-1]